MKYDLKHNHYFIFILQASVEHLEKHYADLSKKPFFAGLVKYMASGPVVAMVWEGLNAVKVTYVNVVSSLFTIIRYVFILINIFGSYSGIILFFLYFSIIQTGRVMLGETNPADSKPGTIRGDFAVQVSYFIKF